MPRAARTHGPRQRLATAPRIHGGKALEDRALYEESFTHYASGNALRLALHAYSAQATTATSRKHGGVDARVL